MDDDDLTRLLDAAGPRVHAAEASVARETRALVTALEAQQERLGSRRRRGAARLGGVLAGVVLVGSSAVAAADLLDLEWGHLFTDPDNTHTVTLRSGNVCQLRVRADMDTTSTTESGDRVPMASVDTLEAADRILARISVKKLDLAAAERQVDAMGLPPAGPEEADTRELQVVQRAIVNELDRRLAAQGRDRSGLTVGSETHCQR